MPPAPHGPFQKASAPPSPQGTMSTPSSPQPPSGKVMTVETSEVSIWGGVGVLPSTLPPKLKPPFPAHQPQPPCPGNQATCAATVLGAGEQEAKNKLCRREGVRETTCNTKGTRKGGGGLWEGRTLHAGSRPRPPRQSPFLKHTLPPLQGPGPCPTPRPTPAPAFLIRHSIHEGLFPAL